MTGRQAGMARDVLIGLALAAALVGGALILFGDRFPGGTPNATGAGKPDGTLTIAEGRKLYGQHCASCHGVNLEGEKDWRVRNGDGTLKAPPHDASGHTWHHSDALLFRYTKEGGAKVVGGSFKSAMPGFGDKLSDAEIRAILRYIKSRWPKDIRERQAQISKMRQ